MAIELTLEQASKILGMGLEKNLEEAFYEQLKPRAEAIARTAAKNLAHSYKGYVQQRFDNFHKPQIVLVLDKKELGLE